MGAGEDPPRLVPAQGPVGPLPVPARDNVHALDGHRTPVRRTERTPGRAVRIDLPVDLAQDDRVHLGIDGIGPGDAGPRPFFRGRLAAADQAAGFEGAEIGEAGGIGYVSLAWRTAGQSCSATASPQALVGSVMPDRLVATCRTPDGQAKG
ncbi:hypothetical protein C8N38_101372 [Rhodovulum kholense]|uniref:Uncharacterized protein n=1 Tax=Rhodovulum kholense TaxID=453584 RepID=A0A8E3ASE3_9RHOB|nr:hypothetical protein C8N38_101372 [Rhodovulum kholense]